MNLINFRLPGPGFDCTGKHAEYAKSAKHANTMATIANIMENQQQQMNKITDVLAGTVQFLVQSNLSQITPNNGVPPSTSQQSLGQNTPERVRLIDRNDNDDQVQQANQTDRNTSFGVLPNTSQTPMVSCQTTQSRVPPTCTDAGEKGDETLPLAASSLFFQGNEIQKDVHPSGEKEDENYSSASGSTHDEDRKYWLQSTEEYNDVVEVGPEVSPSMASATKIFCEKPLKCRQIKV